MSPASYLWKPVVSQNWRLCSAWPSATDFLLLLSLLLLVPLAVASAVGVIHVERRLLLLLMSLLVMLVPTIDYLLPAFRQAQARMIYSVMSSVCVLRHDKHKH